MSEPQIGNILCLNKAIQYSSKRTRYCTYKKTISLRLISCTQKKNAAMFDITHMLMLMAAQCLQVSLQQKGLTLQGILCLLCQASKKKMPRDNVYQRQRRTPSFHIAITAAY